MKAGFVAILGLANAGKSTLLNGLLGEKLAIISPKVQTTRHRIKGIITEAAYQLVISDTPGIIPQTEYKLHEKMMRHVKGAVEDADVAICLVDVNKNWDEIIKVFQSLHIKSPIVIALNKIDKANEKKIADATQFFLQHKWIKAIVPIAAINKQGLDALIQHVLEFIPEGEPFYNEEEISDLPTRFFVQELIREKLYTLFEDEIPYQSTVLVTEFKEKQTLIKIAANIIVQRESQKGIIIGEGGRMIKKIGIEARRDIEQFLDQKIFLELFVKARDKWRDNDTFLREYGYH
jgi:GTPase